MAAKPITIILTGKEGFAPRPDPEASKDDLALDLHPWNYSNGGMLKALDDDPSLLTMAGWTLDQQAEYADAITSRYCKNPRFIKQMTEGHVYTRADVKVINSTGVGNMAMMRKHNPDNKAVVSQYETVMELIRKYAK